MGYHLLLLVSTHEERRRGTVDLIVRSGYVPRTACGLTEAVDAVCRTQPSVVMIDALDDDGPELCRAVRPFTSAPIVGICAPHDEERTVECLQAGADSVLREPLSRRLLAARLDALVRSAARREPFDRQRGHYRLGDLSVDLERHRATVGGERLPLTPTEFRLLAALARRAGDVVPHDHLSREVWGDVDASSAQNVRLYVRYLRRKLADGRHSSAEILARRGAGYVLSVSEGKGRNVRNA